MFLSRTVTEILRDNGRQSLILIYPPYLAPPLGVTPLEFCQDLWQQQTSPRAIVWRCLHDHRFSHFGRTPTCDGPTDHDDSIYRASLALLGKNESIIGWSFYMLVSVCSQRTSVELLLCVCKQTPLVVLPFWQILLYWHSQLLTWH